MSDGVLGFHILLGLGSRVDLNICRSSHKASVNVLFTTLLSDSIPIS